MAEGRKTKRGHAAALILRSMGPAVLSALLVAGLAIFQISRSERRPGVLVAGSAFSITSTISSSSTSEVTALLYPGVQRYLWYTVHNPLTDTITVQSITAAIDPANQPPAGCPASNLDLSASNFSGALSVGPGGTASAARPIALKNTNASQNVCQGVTFHFVYSGTATYAHLYATTTSVTSSQNPSTYGQKVTFTASVSPVGTPPSPPTGTVTFYEGTTAIASSPVGSTGQATYATSTLAAGTHSIKATFTAGDPTNFSASSGTLSQQVSRATPGVTLTSTPNPSTFGQTVTFAANVATSTPPLVNPTGSVTFYDGSNTLGTVALTNDQAKLQTAGLAPGTHTVTATYLGDVNFASSTSNPVTQQVNFTSSCINTKQNKSLVVQAGQAICITASGSIGGNIMVNAGGALYDVGGPVAGNVTSVGATAITFCSASVSGNVSISSSTGPVLLGDAGDDGSPACGGDAIGGNVTLNGNLAGVEVGATTIGGALTLTGNTGVTPGPEGRSSEVEKNSISGSLGCTLNTPAPTNDGQANTVKGQRTGQCAGF